MFDDFPFYIILGSFVLIVLLALAFTFGEPEDNQETTQEITSFSALGYEDNVYDYVDPDTGVHYLVYCGYRKGGITVRLNPDGSIMVDSDIRKQVYYELFRFDEEICQLFG